MATNIGIGFSQDMSTPEAALQAATQAKEDLGKDSKVDLAIIFSTIHYNPLETLLVVRKTLGEPRTIGCSTAGVILSEMISQRGIAVLAISSDEINFGVGSGNDIDNHDPRMAGVSVAKSAINDFGQHRRLAFLFFVDGLFKNNSLLLKGLHEVFGNIFPIVGAGSSDDFHFKKTYQYSTERAMTNGVTGLLVGGQIKIGLGTRHGWKPLGKPRFITKTTGHIINTIDGQRASRIYEEYLGDEAKHLRATTLGRMSVLYPLGIYIEEEKEYILRNPVDILSDGSIVCQGDIPEGAEVHIMIGNKDSCRQAAIDAANEAQEAFDGKPPKLVMVFENLGRSKLLGRGAFKEIQLIKEIFGHNVPIIGMYSSGEITPLKSEDNVRRTHLQNESIIVLAIG